MSKKVKKVMCPTCHQLRDEDEFVSFECLLCESVRADVEADMKADAEEMEEYETQSQTIL